MNKSKKNSKEKEGTPVDCIFSLCGLIIRFLTQMLLDGFNFLLFQLGRDLSGYLLVPAENSDSRICWWWLFLTFPSCFCSRCWVGVGWLQMSAPATALALCRWMHAAVLYKIKINYTMQLNKQNQRTSSQFQARYEQPPELYWSQVEDRWDRWIVPFLYYWCTRRISFLLSSLFTNPRSSKNRIRKQNKEKMAFLGAAVLQFSKLLDHREAEMPALFTSAWIWAKF